ncbi:MAG: Bifunctional ligase/repressor BirA [Candidatus Anoxychlamydiales bacterium]|nr:Bifunctional ligase/repressor BirA [Candidatus Anoxychlamydiales bacterium]
MKIQDIFLDEVTSTQEYAKKNISSLNEDDFICISAKKQTNGKGRFKRTWLSNEGNLFLTYVFKLKKNILHLTSISHILALSLIEVLIDENIKPFIKWPNDIFLNNKKLSGILCELKMEDDFVNVYIGIGINVNMNKEELEKIDKPATSLSIEIKKEWNLKELQKKLSYKFIKNLKIFKNSGFTQFHEKFENLLLYKGDKIKFFDGEKEHVGILHSITCDGRLNLYMPNKEIKTFSSGDIN